MRISPSSRLLRTRRPSPVWALAGALLMVIPVALNAQAQSDTAASAPAALVSGIDLQNVDSSVRPQDDYFRYVNGRWLASAQIPADKPSWGAFPQLQEHTLEQQKAILDELGSGRVALDAEGQKVAKLYASFMDEARVEQVGIAPLQAEFAHIDALQSKNELPALFARLERIGVNLPFSLSIAQDQRDSTKYAVYLDQSGLGLPDRDYYLKDDPEFVADRSKYQAHLQKMLAMAGDAASADDTPRVLAVETALAKVQWDRVETRDADKVYNPMPVDRLKALADNFDWDGYLSACGIPAQPFVVVGEPTYFGALKGVIDSQPLEAWRAYLRWKVLSRYARYLPAAFVDEHFNFYGRTLTGVQVNEPRWKRGLHLVDEGMGMALGKLYVARYFSPRSKERMLQLVNNLRDAYAQAFTRCEWMDHDTRKAALEKLFKFTPQVGYPDRWRDYSALVISSNDLFGNVTRSSAFEFDRNAHKLGKPIDRSEWEMNPQLVNAYYDQNMNEIVFPAAILQPPFFNEAADDAVNYGAIGAVIGHEMSHGFDDQGRKYDGDGNKVDWWTAATAADFEKRKNLLIRQYNGFEPLPGHFVNGARTIGENIADLAGLNIAYEAYILSLKGQKGPEIDGLSGIQRFFMGWGQVWRYKGRDQDILRRLTVDVHSPPQFRVDGSLRNTAPFYEAYGVRSGDKMYLKPNERVILY